MTKLQERLFAMQDKEYALFQAKLTPGIPMERFIGVKVPLLRAFAKTYIKEEESKDFLHQLPHEFYDEDMLHGLLISLEKDYDYIPAAARSEAYYVKMMVAWFFATALAKQGDATIPYLQDKRLATWTHNKTIQKACESYKITPEQKQYLKNLRIK